MSINQRLRNIDTINKRIIRLGNSKADMDAKAAKCDKDASKVKISKNDSEATIKRKRNKILKLQADASNYRTKSSQYSKEIAKENKNLAEANKKLEDERSKESKKQEKIISNFQELYEDRVKNMELNLIEDKDLSIEDSQEKFDYFISHAYEDKEEFVDGFVSELKKLDLNIWYDDANIPWGGSLREEIDKGLKNSKYGIVILSPSYIEEGKYWTKQELNGLFQKESINQGKIVPVWYNLNKSEVYDYSPMLADMKAMTSANLTPSEMALEFKRIIDSINYN